MVAEVGTPTIKLSTSFWITWAGIAIRRADDAAVARASNDADWLVHETQEGLSAICAVAFSMEALQRAIVAQLGPTPPGKKKPNAIDFLEAALAKALNLSEKNLAALITALTPIYDLRNAGVHFNEAMGDVVPHPSGAHSSIEAAQYNADTATGAVEAMKRVYRALLEHPSSGFAPWVEAQRHAIHALV